MNLFIDTSPGSATMIGIGFSVIVYPRMLASISDLPNWIGRMATMSVTGELALPQSMISTCSGLRMLFQGNGSALPFGDSLRCCVAHADTSVLRRGATVRLNAACMTSWAEASPMRFAATLRRSGAQQPSISRPW